MILLASAICLAERFHFRVFGEQEGLANPVIRHVAQDKQGMLWVIARNGLYRFDGTRLTFMTEQRDRDLHWAQASPDGSMWFRSRRAVHRYADGKFERVVSDDPLPNDTIQWIAGGQATWIITHEGRRLERVVRQGGQWRRETVLEPAEVLHSILARPDGAVFAGCGAGLCERTPAGEWRVLPGVPSDRYVSLVDARDGNLLARGNARLVRLQVKEGRVEDLTGALPRLTGPYNIPSVAVDFHRRVLANGDDGLHRFENGAWRQVGEREGLHDMTRSILVDRDGAIWLGTFNGLHRWLGDGAWTTLGPSEGLPRRGVEVVARDAGDAVWASSALVGVYRGASTPQGWRFREIPGLPPSKALIPPGKDSVWLGPAAGGVLHYDRGKLIPVEGLPASVRVNEFSMDRAHGVLAATTEGLYGQDGPHRMRLLWKSEEILTIGWAPNGDFWMGLQRQIARLRGYTVETLACDDGIEQQGVRAVYGDQQGRIWVGTWGNDGLRAYEPRGLRLHRLSLEQPTGMRADSFFVHLDDQGKAVWAGSNRGLASFRDGRWYRYDRNNGLNSDQCTGACFLPNGSIWFATQGGLAHYEPAKERPPETPPAVMITGWESRFGALPLHGPLVNVPPHEADITVHFSVLSTILDSPARVRYRLGVKEEWHTTARRTLEFLQVGAGEYQLQIEAQGLNGQWTAAPAQLVFRVLPPWWATWWFRLLAVGCTAAIGWLWWQLRLWTERKRHLERLRRVFDRYPGAAWIFTGDFRFLMVNQQMADYLGRPREKVEGRPMREVLRPEAAELFMQNAERIRAAGHHLNYLEQHRVRGEVLTFDVNAFPLLDTKGAMDEICIMATDITSRRKLEQEREKLIADLQAARERYESFVKLSTEGIWRVEVDPPVPLSLPEEEFLKAVYERGVVAETNDAAARRLGAPVAALVGTPFATTRDRSLPEHAATDHLFYVNRCRLDGLISRMTDTEGRDRVLLSNTTGVIEDNQLHRIWAIQRDVTESYRLEEMITNTAKGVSARTGRQFFDLLVEHLATVLEATESFASEWEASAGKMRTLARWRGGLIERDPLDDAASPGSTATDAVVVVPLFDDDRERLGELGAIYSKPTELSTEFRATLDIFASRAAAEIQRLRADREILHYQEQLRALGARIQRINEDERAHWAREIHDELGQYATAMRIAAVRLHSKLQTGESGKALETARDVKEIAEEMTASVRRLSTQLRPPVLDNLGLAAAIRWQAKEASQRMGIPVECHAEEVKASKDIAIIAFRILQECMTNVARHAQAKRIDVELRQAGEGGITLTVVDDGVGFETLGVREGALGLLGMKERAAAANGTLTITSRPGGGTTVVAQLGPEEAKAKEGGT